jgi:hypothetical protein
MPDTAASLDCPMCSGKALLDFFTDAVARYTCARCDHCWEEERPVVTLSTERDRKVGPSPHPCPRCRSVIDITVCYMGRREQWDCGHCGNSWSINANPEQPTT